MVILFVATVVVTLLLLLYYVVAALRAGVWNLRDKQFPLTGTFALVTAGFNAVGVLLTGFTVALSSRETPPWSIEGGIAVFSIGAFFLLMSVASFLFVLQSEYWEQRRAAVRTAK